jgi:hypothetical protein
MTPGMNLDIESIKFNAANSPPLKTKSPIEISSSIYCEINLSSIPSYLPAIIVMLFLLLLELLLLEFLPQLLLLSAGASSSLELLPQLLLLLLELLLLEFLPSAAASSAGASSAGASSAASLA